MFQVIALTQFAFLVLGIMSLVVRARSTGQPTDSILGISVWWLVVIPLVWGAFAILSSRFQKAPFSLSVARASGIFLAVLSFLFMVTVTFSTRR